MTMTEKDALLEALGKLLDHGAVRAIKVVGSVDKVEVGAVAALVSGEVAVVEAQYRGQRAVVLTVVNRKSEGLIPVAMLLRAEDMELLEPPDTMERKPELPTGLYL